MDIEKIILSDTKKKRHIVHGAKSMNFQLPPEFQRPTRDWDLWSKNPAQAMDKLEDILDRESGGDNFYEDTIPLIGSKTGEKVYRVKSRLTGEEVADFMRTPNEKNLYKVISNIRWETLAHAKKVYERILRDPGTTFDRKAKARRDLDRILAFERQLKRGKINGDRLPAMFHFAPVKFAPVKFVRPMW